MNSSDGHPAVGVSAHTDTSHRRVGGEGREAAEGGVSQA
jgi:hypothetical protein